jgi:hypothetical protein
MSSPDLATAGGEKRPEVREKAAGVGALLDTAFGYFVWAIHFLIVYVVEAVACQLGLGVAGPSTQTTLIAVLALVTIAACAVVVVHGFLRHRQQREVPEQRFGMALTIGADAIASIGILGQLFALFLVPVCA